MLINAGGQYTQLWFMEELIMSNTTKGNLTGTNNGVIWSYIGDILDTVPHGKGKYVYEDGETYEGDLANGLRHGKGKYTLPNGLIYEGDFVDDKIQGKGKLTYPEGHVYEGDFVDYMRQGKWKLTFADGSFYEGSDQNGHLNYVRCNYY